MVKVNLLPSYYFEARKARYAALVTSVVVVAVLASLVYWVTGVQAQLANVESEIATVQPKATLNETISKQASAISQEIQPIQQKIKFITDILEFNQKFPLLFQETNKYTIPSIAYNQIQPAVTLLNLSGYARRVSDIGRFLLTAQRAKHLFAAVSITQGIPGWPPPQAGGGDSSAFAGAPGPATSGPNPYGGPAGGSPYGPGPYGGGGAAAGAGGTTQPGPVSFSTGQAIDLGGGFRFVPVSARPQPATLPFTAVAQLQPVFYLTPPVSPYGGATTDMTGYGGYPSSGPVPGGAGPVPGSAPGAPPSNGASAGPSDSGNSAGGGLGAGRGNMSTEE